MGMFDRVFFDEDRTLLLLPRLGIVPPLSFSHFDDEKKKNAQENTTFIHSCIAGRELSLRPHLSFYFFLAKEKQLVVRIMSHGEKL